MPRRPPQLPRARREPRWPAEDRAALLDAVDGLRDEDRLIIACRLLLDLGEAETAAVLDLPRGTVKSRLSRALDRLRDRLEVAPA